MNQSTGFLAAFITLICWTIGTFSFTKASKLYEPNSVNRVRLLYAFILLSFLTCIILRINPIELFTKPFLTQWLWLGISGILGLSIGDYFAFTAFKILGSGRSSLFNTFAPTAALFGGYFFLNESINFMGIFGMLISIIGVIWFIKSNSTVEINLNTTNFNKGLLFAFLGAICQGLGLVFAKMGLIYTGESQVLISPIYATWIRLFVATVFIYATGIFKINLWKELKEISSNKIYFKPIIIGTVFGPVIGVSMSLYAASILEVSLAQTIFSFLPISVISYSYLKGNEKIKPQSILAALLSICGVLILIYRTEIEAVLKAINFL